MSIQLLHVFITVACLYSRYCQVSLYIGTGELMQTSPISEMANCLKYTNRTQINYDSCQDGLCIKCLPQDFCLPKVEVYLADSSWPCLPHNVALTKQLSE